ncbi:MAG: hypothetical protein K6F35_11710, partial [Lachnospiraceae bacterium]|nr:hypothetical protein [Lachnospiraceae bacterium]
VIYPIYQPFSFSFFHIINICCGNTCHLSFCLKFSKMSSFSPVILRYYVNHTSADPHFSNLRYFLTGQPKKNTPAVAEAFIDIL